MKQILEFRLEDGSTIAVEAAESSGGPVVRGARGGGAVTKAHETFEEALGHLRPVARATMNVLRDLSPDEVSVEMGVKFSAATGIVIASASGEAAFTVRLTWKGGGGGAAAASRTGEGHAH
jgi:hypothetical protein